MAALVDGYSTLENLSNSGNPPKTRVKDAASARTILYTLIEDDQISSYRRAQIQGIIDGNAPYNEQVLREQGQSERININWGHAEGKVENACLPYFDMLTAVPTYAVVKTAYGKPEKREDWSGIISEEFHRLLANDPSFLKQHQVAQKQMVIHGPACMYFPDARDWRARSIDVWNLVVPRGAKVNWNEWEFCFVLDEYYCEQLYKYIRDPEAAKRNGWNVENTKESIMEAQVDVQDQRRPWEWYQRELKNNGLYYSYAKSKVVKLAHMYVKEFDGRYSHYIFDRLQPTEWLCKKIGRYKTLSQAFTIFTNGIGNGYYHGIRGLGQKVYKYGEGLNRVNNSLLEGVILGSSLMLQPATANDVSKIQAITIGPYRVLPPGLNFTQVNTSSNLGAAMQVASYFQGQEADQISSFIPTLDNSGKKKSPKETEVELGEKAKLTNTRASVYLADLDTHYTEVYRRAANPNLLDEDPGGRDALEFQARCIRRGVPKAALMHIESVRAYRSVGQGSSAARMLAMKQVSEFLPMLPESSRIKVINSTIASIVGQSGLELYGIKEDEKPTGMDASVASLENNAFMSGGQVILDPNQNHYIHASIHIQFAGEIVRAVQKGKMDPRKAIQILQSLGPHLLMHLKFLSEDPTRKQQYEQLKKEAAELMKIADQIAKMAERLNEQDQEQQQQQQPEQTPEWAVAQNKIQIDREKFQNDAQIKTAKAVHQMRLKDRTTAQNLQIKKINAQQKQLSAFSE